MNWKEITLPRVTVFDLLSNQKGLLIYQDDFLRQTLKEAYFCILLLAYKK